MTKHHDKDDAYAFATHGKIFPISREALVNDDLGAFTDLARKMGKAAASAEEAEGKE